MIVVVEASVAAMWFLPEPHSPNAALLLTPDYDLVSPDLLRTEVAGALLKSLRKKQISSRDAVEALEILSAAGVRMFPAADYVDAAFHIALDHGGSLYDGIYLALARSLNAPVVTNDARLAAVAKAGHIRALMIGAGPPRLPRRSSARSSREEE